MEPARDFRVLVKQKRIPFGEGEALFSSSSFCVSFVEFYESCSALAVAFIVFCLGCGDPVVLLSLSAAHSKDRAVA